MTATKVRPTLAETTLDPRVRSPHEATDPAAPDVNFHLLSEDLTLLQGKVAEYVAGNDVLAVCAWTATCYRRAQTDMDAPDVTETTRAMRITYATPTGEIGMINLPVLSVSAVGANGAVRYRELRAEAEAALDAVLRANPEFTAVYDEVAAKILATRPDAQRLETIRTNVVNALVARKTQAARDEAARTIIKGTHVKVVRGRKVPIGTTGKVFWKGEGTYGWRVGFKDSTDTVHWTALTNVEAIYDDATVVAAALAEAKKVYAAELGFIFGPARA